jgi:putrescine importer
MKEPVVNDPGAFKRVLTLSDLVLFGLAFVGPTAPYSMFGIASVQSFGHLPLVYLIAMLAMSLTAISYGRMAASFPEAGSTYAYASKSLHPNVGYFAGWGMILDYTVIPLMSFIFVGLTANKLVPQVPYCVWVISSATCITIINLCGIKVTARTNALLNAIMVGSLVWFVVMAIRALMSGTGEARLLSVKPFYNPRTFSFSVVMGATSVAAFSFMGFDGISTLSEDAKNPQRDIGRATVLVCFIAGGLFVLESYLAQMIWPDYRTFSPVETAFLDIGKLIGGQALFYFVSFGLLVGGIASAVTGQASASRLLCGMGRDGLLPRRIFGYIHPKLGTPVYSVLLMGGIHLLGALVLRYGEAAELVNFGAFLGFMAVNLSVWRLYYCRMGQRQGSQIVSNLILPIAGFAVCLSIWISLSRFALWLGAFWMLIGVVYLATLTRGFKNTLTDLQLS